MIRAVTENDIHSVCDIYNHYVLNTAITFEEEAVSAGEMKKRIAEITETGPFLVLEEDGEIAGYAYAGKWKGRSAYRHTVETTVYLRENALGKGKGTELYRVLINELKKKNVHAVIAGIAQPNMPSVRLHEKMGFKKAAHFTEVGRKFGKWIDVGYWELLL